MSEKLMMKTPVTYYGGKQNMVKHILPLIPAHNLYCEPFAGGAAIFFAKENAEVNVLNDTNRELMNFYNVVKNDFVALEKEVAITLHSRDMHRKANVVYNNPDMFSNIKRAWALWVLSSQSFCAKLDGSWGYDISKNRSSKHVSNKKGKFMLSSYPSDILSKYSKTHGWNTYSTEAKVSVNTKSGYQKRKIEVLTTSY